MEARHLLVPVAAEWLRVVQGMNTFVTATAIGADGSASPAKSTRVVPGFHPQWNEALLLDDVPLASTLVIRVSAEGTRRGSRGAFQALVCDWQG